MTDGMGFVGELPNGEVVLQWDVSLLSDDDPRDRFQRVDAQGNVLAQGWTLDDVLSDPEESAVVERLSAAGRRWKEARGVERDARDAVYQAVIDAFAFSIPETRIAAIAGVDRMTVRKALGKR